MTTAPLPETYRRALRTLIRFAAAITVHDTIPKFVIARCASDAAIQKNPCKSVLDCSISRAMTVGAFSWHESVVYHALRFSS